MAIVWLIEYFVISITTSCFSFTGKLNCLPRCLFLHPKWFYPLKVQYYQGLSSRKQNLCTNVFCFRFFDEWTLKSLFFSPSNYRAALRQCRAQWKEKHGHTTIDLGIAPEKLLQSCEGGEVKEIDPMERLKHVRGHVVSFPLEFMQQEDLRPVFNESQFYTSPQVFRWAYDSIRAWRHQKSEIYV